MSHPATRIPFALLELAKHAPHALQSFIPQTQMPPERPSCPHPYLDNFDVFANEDHRIACAKEWQAWVNACEAHKREVEFQRYCQWPLVWAQGVLAAAKTLGLEEPEDSDFEVAEGKYRDRAITLTKALVSLLKELSQTTFIDASAAVFRFEKIIAEHGVSEEGTPYEL